MKSTLKRTWAEIDLDAIEHNYRTLKDRVGKDTKFLGVVKADAYGHGAVMVAKTLEEIGADYLAVSSIDEAMELRLNHIEMPILILGHTPKEQVARLIEYNITQAVSCEAKALEYSEEAEKLDQILKVHIKIDTGMSRLGYLCEGDHFETGVKGIVHACELPGLCAEGVFTHFSMSDESDENCVRYTEKQFQLFMDVVSSVEEKLGKRFDLRHCANTGAVAKYPKTYLDMVRPGLLLYGYGEFAEKLDLKPVMTLKSTISTIKVYSEGTPISYGGIYVTDKKTRMGVIPYGYADGFFRCLSNKCSVMTDEGKAMQRGKICMDMSMIDLTDKMSVDVGSEVEIFGKRNSINELAELAGTIPYEITCAVSKRVPRLYIREGEVIEKELLLRM